MTEIEGIAGWEGMFSYKPTQVLKWLLTSPCKITCIFSGNQFGKNECLSALTLIDTPEGKFTMEYLYNRRMPFEVYSWDGDKIVKAKASKPFKKSGGKRLCYKITMANGQWVEASSEHRVLTTSGDYISVGTLYDFFRGSPQEKVYEKYYKIADEPSHRESILGFFPSIQFEDVLHYLKRVLGFLGCCFHDFHLNGGQPLGGGGSETVFFRLLNDVRQHIYRHVLQKDVLDSKYASIQKLVCGLLSILCVYHRNVVRFFESLLPVFCIGTLSYTGVHQNIQRLPIVSNLLSQSYRLVSDDRLFPKISYAPPLIFDGNKVISIEMVASQEVYDMTVEKYHNYLAGGLIHHNSVAMDQIFSILGTHPNVNKRVRPEDTIRTFRFASQTLPGEKEEDEVKNTQYPAFKRRLPANLIEKEITQRKPTLTVKTPDGGNVQIEFVSFQQDVQSGAGVQRKRIWIDEECTRDFYEEQIPRLLAADGDIVFTFTPVPGAIGWEFDELYERAKIIYRTPAVRQRIKERYGEDYPECQITKSKDDICVIMAATDDNPVYEEVARKRSLHTGIKITAKEYIDSMFNMYDDEDVIDARRYGLFRQLSGKIHKSFCATHILKEEVYFPEGIPTEWKHYRGIDYHQSNPWACVWLSLSPQDEIFVWDDYAPSPQRMITYDIAENIARRSHDFRYVFNMIDPNASNRQPNTNLTTIDDLNRAFMDFRTRGLCNGGHWQAWDTHGGRGREELTKRLINSVKVGKPFNNKVVSEGRAVYLPTIWFTQNCKNTIESLKNWRLEQWSSRESLSKNDPREKTQMRWSHFPICIECMLKSPLLSLAKWGNLDGTPLRPKLYASGRN